MGVTAMAVEVAEASMAVGARPAVEANTEGDNMGEAMRITEEAITEEAMRIMEEAMYIIMGIMGDTPGGGG